MSSTRVKIQEDAYNFAKRDQIYFAQKVIGALVAYGFSDEEIEALRKNVGITYLKHCDNPIFGGVDYYDYRLATVDDNGEDGKQYIGLSPYAYRTFSVTDFVYVRNGKSQVVLFEFEKAWFYINLSKNYGGRVVTFHYNKAWVIPYFDLEWIKAKAQERIRNLEYHEWELPENFSMASSEFEATQQEQTELALDHYGFNNAGVEDA